MSTLQLNSELYRQLSYIADDEDCMQKVLKAVKKIVAGKVAAQNEYAPRTKEQLKLHFKEALAEVQDYQQGKKELPPIEKLLNEL